MNESRAMGLALVYESFDAARIASSTSRITSLNKTGGAFQMAAPFLDNGGLRWVAESAEDMSRRSLASETISPQVTLRCPRALPSLFEPSHLSSSSPSSDVLDLGEQDVDPAGEIRSSGSALVAKQGTPKRSVW